MRHIELTICVTLNCFAGLFAGIAVSHVAHQPTWAFCWELYLALALSVYSCVRAIVYYP